VRLCRARKRFGGDDGTGGGQRALFPRVAAVKGKPPQSAPVPEPTLFENDLLATFGGAVLYAEAGSVSDKNRYSVKLETRPPNRPSVLTRQVAA
jgi:hypothetical protein